MATPGDNREESLSASPSTTEVIPAETLPLAWVENAVDQARVFKASAEEAVHFAFHVATTRLSEIASTASAHSQYTLEIFRGYAEEGEDLAFSKLKEGILIAAAYPEVSCAVAAGLGIVVFKRPRRAIFHYVRQFFVNEESLLSSAEARAKALQQSFANMKHEGKKIEERASMAENDFLSSKTRLRHAGQQIQGLINSTYRLEKKTRGLKDILREIPRKDASLFRSKISSLTTDVKREKKSLVKEVNKITGCGISI